VIDTCEVSFGVFVGEGSRENEAGDESQRHRDQAAMGSRVSGVVWASVLELHR